MHAPLYIKDTGVGVDPHTHKFLGDHVTDNLTWSLHTSFGVKTAHQRLHFLQSLKRAHLSPSILTTYKGTIESSNQQHLSVAREQQCLRQGGTGESGEVTWKNHWAQTAPCWSPGETTLPIKGNTYGQGSHSPLSQTILPPTLRKKIPSPAKQNKEAQGLLLTSCH